MPKLLNLIVACSENRVIGREGKLPWRIPEDLAFFHAETAGQICVLGRVCYETWPRVGLDGRQPVVLASRPIRRAPTDSTAEDARVRARERENEPVIVHSLGDALHVSEELPGEIFICGGQRIYEETLALRRPMRLHLTLIHAVIPGDTFFPEWRHLDWREVSRRESADTNYRYTFFTLER
jgi:dihydrofolate reductase